MKNKSIIINEKSHKDLSMLSETFGTTYGKLVEAMITYFKKTGINPNDALNQNPSDMVKALDKRIVSFLKVQERDILQPLRNEIYSYQNDNIKRYNNINQFIINIEKGNRDNLNKMNSLDEKRNQTTLAQLAQINKAVFLLSEYVDLKNKSGIQGKINSIFGNANK